MQTTNILICGVGGQGTILAARVLSRLLLARGHDLKVSEIHGMSQRGGSVLTQVRYGDAVAAPMIGVGEADYILAFEKMEALRMLPYLKQGGVLIANDRELAPMPVITGAAVYPPKIAEHLNQCGATVRLFDAYGMALAAGNDKALNMVLLGAWAASAGFGLEECLAVVRATVKPRFIAVNEKAFTLGFESHV